MRTTDPAEREKADSQNNGPVDRLAALTRDLSQKSGDAIALMREHLESAHSCQVATMREEYLFNLKLAKQLLPEVEDPVMRERVADFLRTVESEERTDRE